MTATYSEARDEMFRLFQTAFNAGAADIVNYVPEIRWQGVEEKDAPPEDKFWVRVSTQNVTSRQSAFVSDDAPAQSAKEFTNRGLIFVQVFAPRSLSKEGSFVLGGKLAEFVQSIFQNAETSSSVWFRNVRINELPPEDKAYPFNVVAEYTFDQLN